MIQSLATAIPNQVTSAYSFEISTSVNRKNALYRQAMAHAGLTSGQVVLELGCSDGNSSAIMATVNIAENDAIGILPCLREIRALETSFGNRNPNHFLSWRVQSFDTIFCIGIMNQLADPARTMAMLHRLLSENGKLIIADQWFRNAGPMFETLLQPYLDRHDPRIYSPSTVINLLKKSGFGLIETRPAGATNFLCTAIALS